MSSKYERLANRLDERLRVTPPRGRAVDPSFGDRGGTAEEEQSEPMPSHVPASVTAPRQMTPDLTRVRRSHLVPASLHQRARREKVLRSGVERITWSDVLADGVRTLVDHPDPNALVERSASSDEATRLIQAYLPVDLDRRFRQLYLDLADGRRDDVTYEELWATSVELWLSS